MQSEEFDKKAKEAAEHHHPPYDEKAWEKMEKLLNKHLPQEKDGRKRIAVILLLLLLLGGGGFLLIARPWVTKKNSISSIIKDQPNQPSSPNPPVQQEKQATSSPEKNSSSLNNQQPAEKKAGSNEPSQTKLVQQNTVARISPTKLTVPTAERGFAANAPRKRSTLNQENRKAGEKENVIVDQPDAGLQNNSSTKPESSVTSTRPDPRDSDPEKKTADSQVLHPEAAVQGATNATIPKTPELAKTNTAAKTKKGNKKGNDLFFTLSAGPDVSTVGSEYFGRLRLITGGGIGYTFRNKLTLRAGINSSRKIYTAPPYKYHPPTNFWVIYPDMQEIDADCKVLEIPVALSYHFGSSPNHSWFASAGLSSYLMKRETYDYFYKNASGQLENWKATIHNKNSHYFSVLTLSGGYERRLNKTVSIMAEPFLKLPLNGVGYGKVKLADAGVLFTVGIHPFNPSKPK